MILTDQLCTRLRHFRCRAASGSCNSKGRTGDPAQSCGDRSAALVPELLLRGARVRPSGQAAGARPADSHLEPCAPQLPARSCQRLQRAPHAAHSHDRPRHLTAPLSGPRPAPAGPAPRGSMWRASLGRTRPHLLDHRLCDRTSCGTRLRFQPRSQQSERIDRNSVGVAYDSKVICRSCVRLETSN